jgi:hypothetical protein
MSVPLLMNKMSEAVGAIEGEVPLHAAGPRQQAALAAGAAAAKLAAGAHLEVAGDHLVERWVGDEGTRQAASRGRVGAGQLDRVGRPRRFRVAAVDRSARPQGVRQACGGVQAVEGLAPREIAAELVVEADGLRVEAGGEVNGEVVAWQEGIGGEEAKAVEAAVDAHQGVLGDQAGAQRVAVGGEDAQLRLRTEASVRKVGRSAGEQLVVAAGDVLREGGQERSAEGRLFCAGVVERAVERRRPDRHGLAELVAHRLLAVARSDAEQAGVAGESAGIIGGGVAVHCRGKDAAAIDVAIE